MASKNPQTAVRACFLAGIVTLVVCVPFTYLGAFSRWKFGPDSAYAQFAPDT